MNNCVRNLRLTANLTVEELAGKANVTITSIKKAEAGDVINIWTADKIAAALERCLGDVFQEPRLKSCKYCREGRK